MANNANTIEELEREVLALVEEVQALVPAIEGALNHQLAKSGKRLVRVGGEDDPDVEVYALPTAYHDPQAESEATTTLRQQLTEAEADVESADSFVQRTRARQRVENLRRDLDFASMDPPAVNAEVVAVQKVPTEEKEFAPPDTERQTDPELIQEETDRFERRMRRK